MLDASAQKFYGYVMQSELSRHVIAIFVFKILMLGVLGYLFYSVIGKPHITPASVAANLFEPGKGAR